MSERVRFGLLSTAHINRLLLATRDAAEGYEFVAVASRDEARAQAYARDHAIERAHGSYGALLADADVDAVYIALPNALHHEWTMRALHAGKHVLCEKPYSRRPHEVEEAFATAQRAGLVLMEGFMWRHNPQTTRLLDLLPEIGELVAIRATFAFANDREDDIRLVSELGGGALLDLGCYCISGSRLLAGREPERVYAELVRGRGGVDEVVTALLNFGNVTAEIACNFRSEHQGLEAIGTRGSLFVPDPWHAREGMVVLNGEEERVEPVSSYLLELENLSAAVRGEAEPLLGRDDALGQARVLDAVFRSGDTRRAIDLG
jgi:xylose dehydrogenase (NAD/NADP)